MTNFQVDGATAGNDGQIVQIDGDATSFKYCGIAAPAAPVATILSGPTEQPNQSTTSTTATFFFQATELGITEAGVTLGMVRLSSSASLTAVPSRVVSLVLPATPFQPLLASATTPSR